MPSVQDKVATQEEGANVREKEKELYGRLMRSVIESEDEGHGQIHGAKESKEEEIKG